MRKSILLLAVFVFNFAWAQEEEPAGSCSLAVITTVLPAASEDRAGKAKIEVILLTKEGAPLSGREIQVSSTGGTFLCELPDPTISEENLSSNRTCFTTGDDGRARIFLVNIPFNSNVRIKAGYGCDGDYEVYAKGTVTINRRTFHKGKVKQVNPE